MKKKELNEIIPYCKPYVTVTILRLEQGIVAASTLVSPVDPNNDILVEDWVEGDDIGEDVNW